MTQAINAMVNAPVQEEAKFALFRITVLGGPGCGKTSLINVFVNNFCPTVYTETDDPMLYYKTLNLPPKRAEPAKGAEEPFPAIVEIEDTYATTRVDGVDGYGSARDIKSFLRIEDDASGRLAEVDGDGKSALAFGCAPMPKVGKYEPITRNRMAFMIVFDASDENSLTEAIDAYLSLEGEIKAKKAHLNPVVYLVANKSDKGTKNVLKAEEFAETKKPLPVRVISAYEIRKVKKLFREILSDVRENRMLWNPNPQDDEGIGETVPGQAAVAAATASLGAAAGINKDNCTIQ